MHTPYESVEPGWMESWEMTDKRGEQSCRTWIRHPIKRIPLKIRLHCLLSFCKRCLSGCSCVIKLCRNLAIKESQLLHTSDGLYVSCLMLTERHQEAGVSVQTCRDRQASAVCCEKFCHRLGTRCDRCPCLSVGCDNMNCLRSSL